VAEINDIGFRGALYLRVNLWFLKLDFHPEERWDIIPNETRETIKHV
jgi:sigma54-dependent transcription regulator